ncbi:hypothetical protein [uncultured Nocardioides sp.]|uniref:hypothetical protein n=1 Tax=uncultured Nocardioides sp. TaxID=198441 RepID=UPI002609F682|nr:hypothetical protein [uncultured Nocardioides sp.]
MSRAAPRRRAEKPRRARRTRPGRTPERTPERESAAVAAPAPSRPADPTTLAPSASPAPTAPARPVTPPVTITSEGVTPTAAAETDGPTGPTQDGSRLDRWRARAVALGESRVPHVSWWLLLLAGVGLLVAGVVPVGPAWLGGAGSVAVATSYVWALAARTGGRPVVFGTLTALVGVVVLLLDDDRASTGAAVMTCALAAVLAVMMTVPAKRFREAARECAVAVAIASVGAFATVGFEPALTVVRFQYATLGLALAGAFLLVYRLGAGLHGLGRRGLIATVGGGVVLLVFVGYAELLRQYGPGDVVTTLLDGVRWSRENLGAFPRPLETVLGVPALAWGCHMRARRRQGWWVCAFGAAGTVSIANALVDPSVALLESGLSVGYGLLIGLVIGYVVIRVDLALTGSRGRRARRDEQASAVRPEPRRTAALL